MSEQFVAFQSFSDIELAKHLSERLTESKIEHQLDKAAPILDSTILGTSSNPDYTIKIRASDFMKANHSLEDYYKQQLSTIESDYYLFDFSNQELFEILSKPDEWNPLDHQLSQKILIDRGEVVDETTIQKYNDSRIQILAEPDKASRTLIIIGYCFFLPFGCIVSIFIGRRLLHEKKTLPNGQTVPLFTENDRRHGKRMIKIGTILLFASFVVVILRIIFFLLE